jgi:NAD-dependent deacetylase
MERLGLLKHVITQNIDNLHAEAGSTLVTEIHGNRTKMRCVECVRRWPREEFTTDEMPPRCPDCGGLVKSDTVMFGEGIPRDAMESCFREAQRADAILLAGTSAVVIPAAELPLIVYRNGGKLVEVNPQETQLSELCAAVLRAPSGEALPRLVDRARELVA